MKKIAAILMLFTLIAMSVSVQAQEKPYILLDGQRIEFENAPINRDGRLFYPLRELVEGMGGTVEWHGEFKLAICNLDGINVSFIIDQPQYLVGMDSLFEVDVAPFIDNGRTYLPVRYVGEGFGMNVSYNDALKVPVLARAQIQPTPTERAENAVREDLWLEVGRVRLWTGMTKDEVYAKLGEPQRISVSTYQFKWYVYNSDYEKFVMVGIDDNGKVQGILSLASTLVTPFGKLGDKNIAVPENLSNHYYLHRDPTVIESVIRIENPLLYAVVLASEEEVYWGENHGAGPYKNSPEYWPDQESIIIDLVNAFRVSHGLNSLVRDVLLDKIAGEHAQDMLDRNFYSHTNLEGLDSAGRYGKAGGDGNVGASEWIASSRTDGIAYFFSWLNSPPHRKGLLWDHLNNIGVGCRYSVERGSKSALTAN